MKKLLSVFFMQSKNRVIKIICRKALGITYNFEPGVGKIEVRNKIYKS